MKTLYIALVLLFSLRAHSELNTTRYLAHPLDSTFNILNLVANDSPIPLSDAKEGVKKWSVRPVYLKINQVYHTTEGQGGGASYRGQDLDGTGINVAYSHSFGERTQIYGLFNNVRTKGSIIGKEPANRANDTDVITGENQVFNLSAGLGYDTLDGNEKWSIPIFIGIFLQKYKSEMTSTALSSVHPNTTIYGDGIQTGISAGVQFAYRASEKFSITPYTFVGLPLQAPEVDVTVTNTNGNAGFQYGKVESGELEKNPMVIIGVNVTYQPWNLSLGLGGLVSKYFSKEIYEGLELTSYSLTFSW